MEGLSFCDRVSRPVRCQRGRDLTEAWVVLIALAVVTRFGGAYRVGSFDVATVLFGGMVALVAACLAYVAAMAEYSRP